MAILMSNVVEAVYENGVFRPVKVLHIKENETALIILKGHAKKKSMFGSIPDLKPFSENDRADSK